MNDKRIKLNIIATVILQIVVTISGLIVPRVILATFGSETNGLVASLTQFLNYVTLLEGGISGVVMASLYKPLREGNNDKVSGIVVASQKFFRQIGIIYIGYAIILSLCYPVFVKNHFSYWYTVILCNVLALQLFVQYFFSLSLQILIKADRKVFFVSITQIIITVINIIIVVVSARVFKDIVILKLLSGLVYLIQPIMYSAYVRKNFNLNKKIEPDQDALSQRWDGFGQNLAYFIHENTDIVVLTFLATLTEVSIYSVYYMVASALKNLIVSISNAIVPSFGNVLAGDNIEESNNAFDAYEFVIFYTTTLLFSCGISLIIPFICLYTRGIADANYKQEIFSVLIMVAEMIYSIRNPYINVAYSAGHFKQTSKYAYIEAAMNILISVLMVKRFGLVGVAIGTAFSMGFRAIAHAYYLKNNILFRNPLIFWKKIISFGSASLISILICKSIPISVDSWMSWGILACITFCICLTAVSLCSFIFYKKIFVRSFGTLIKKKN